MFTFCPGFEAAALKIPISTESDDGSVSSKKQIVGFLYFSVINSSFY
jgi:hypothetical protein